MRKRAARSIVALLTAFVFLLTITPVAVFTEDAAPGAGTPIITGEQPSGNDVSIFHADIQFYVTAGSTITDGAAMTITVDGATYTAPLSAGNLESGFFTCALTEFSDGAEEPLGLAYDKTYIVSLPAGAFKNADGSASSAAYSWSFTTMAARIYIGTISPQTYDKGSDNTVVLTIEDSSWDNLASLSLDSTLLTKDTHYTAENNGQKAVFTLDKGYLDGLNNGKYTLKAEFYDGLFSGEFTITGNTVYQGTMSPKTYNVDTGGDATLTVTDANPSDLVSIKVGDTTLTTDDYTASTSGSDAVFTLLQAYLKTMEAGSYTILAEFSNGSCSVGFSVIKGITYVGTVSPEEYFMHLGGTLELTVQNAASASFISLSLDGEQLDPSSDFTTKTTDEDVIFTLNEKVLQKLAAGSHWLEVELDDGGCHTSFVVKEPKDYSGYTSPEMYDLNLGGALDFGVYNAEPGDLIDLSIGDTVLAPHYFTASKEGSAAVFRVNQDFLKTLPLGEHKISAKLGDGLCNASFTVRKDKTYACTVSPEIYSKKLGGIVELEIKNANLNDLVSLSIDQEDLTLDTDYTAKTVGSDIVLSLSEGFLKDMKEGKYIISTKLADGSCDTDFTVTDAALFSTEPTIILFDSELNELGRQPLDGDGNTSFDMGDIEPDAEYYLHYLMEYKGNGGNKFGYNEETGIYSLDGVETSAFSKYKLEKRYDKNNLIEQLTFTAITLNDIKTVAVKVKFVNVSATMGIDFESEIHMKGGATDTRTTISGTMKGQPEKTTNTFTTDDGLISIETSQQLPASCRLVSTPVSDEAAAKMLSSLPPGQVGERYADIKLVDTDGKKVAIDGGARLTLTIPDIGKGIGKGKWLVIARNLNARTGPSTSHQIIGHLKRGDIVTGELMENKAWLKINYNGGIAYVSISYVKQLIVDNNPSGTGGAGAEGTGGAVGIPAGAVKATPVGVLHLPKGGVTEFILAETSYNPSTGVMMAKVSVNSLSPFMLVYDISETNATATSSSPKTGDNSNVIGYLALCLTAGGAGLVFYRRRRMKLLR